MEWISAKKKPKAIGKFKDSDYVLCCNVGMDNSFTFVGWYSHAEKKWTVAHHFATSESATVTHWMPLPEPPKS